MFRKVELFLFLFYDIVSKADVLRGVGKQMTVGRGMQIVKAVGTAHCHRISFSAATRLAVIMKCFPLVMKPNRETDE
jgi:hypothetical protein